MASGTFSLPSGSKIRTGSARRYVVVREPVLGKPYVAYRTDDLHRALKDAATYSGSTRAVIVDTVGRKVRPGAMGLPGAAKWVDA